MNNIFQKAENSKTTDTNRRNNLPILLNLKIIKTVINILLYQILASTIHAKI